MCPLSPRYRARNASSALSTLVRLGSLRASRNASHAVSPGTGFGEYGEGFVRIALVENEHRIRQAARNLKKFLADKAATMHNVIPIPQKASR